MTVIASTYLNASIFSCVAPIALLVGLVYWYVRAVGKVPWARNEIPTNGKSRDQNPPAGGGSAAHGA